MKKILLLFALLTVAFSSIAQTLNIVIGNVTYAIPSSEAGDMIYSDGSTLTILDKVYTLSEIDSMYIDDSEVTDNTVKVAYSGSSAKVTIAGNCARYLTPAVSGADVNIVQNADLANEITYTLSGSSSDGSFFMDGELKATVVLNGLTLTNADGYAIDIEDGKRIAVVLNDGTTNTLADGADGSQKACFMVNGHTEFEGGGTLVLYGNAKHAFWGDEYVLLKESTGTITVKSAANDGFNINQYFRQNGGTINISGVGDDGIQVTADDDYSGFVMLKGGNQNITVTAAATKGITAEGDISINDSKSTPSITINTTGSGEWDSDDNETKASACISSDADITIDAGTLTLKSTGSGGKGIKCDSVLTVNGGDISVTTSGGKYTYGNYGTHTENVPSGYSSSAKGIKSKGNMFINGGTIAVSTSGDGAEGIESKSELTISGGTVEVSANDDAINSSGNMYIKGGKIYVTASGNDGLDANGNMYISGGTIVAYGTTSPECGIDANEEGGYTVFFTGGTLIGVGGGNSKPSTSASTQGYVTYSGSVSNGTTLLLRNGSTDVLAFTMGRTYSSGGGGFGGGHGGSGTSFIMTSPAVSSGTKYSLYSGASVSGDSWHGLYSSPAVSSTGSSLSTLTAAAYSR